MAYLESHQLHRSWLKLLKGDDRAILTAAAKAEEASSLLLKLGGRDIAGSNDRDEEALAA